MRKICVMLFMLLPISLSAGMVDLTYEMWSNVFYSRGDSYKIAMTAATHKYACVFPIPKSGELNGVSFYTGTVTTGDVLRVTLRGWDYTTGTSPLDVCYATGTVTISDTDDNVWKSVTFDASSTTVRGSQACVVFEFDSYVAGNLELCRAQSPEILNAFTSYYNGTSWATDRSPRILLDYADGGYNAHGLQFKSFDYLTVSSPYERGIRWYVPYQVRIKGIGFQGSAGTSGTVNLLDADNNVIKSVPAVSAGTLSWVGQSRYVAYFDTDVVLSSGTVYRFTIKPTSGNFMVGRVIVPSSAYSSVLPGADQMYYTYRNGTGEWTDDPLTYLSIGPIINGIEGPSTGTGTGETIYVIKPSPPAYAGED